MYANQRVYAEDKNMKNLTEWVYKNEPVDKKQIKSNFGTEGLKETQLLLEDDALIRGRSGKIWYSGHWEDNLVYNKET